MKKQFTVVLLMVTLFFTSVTSAFGASKLDKPVINEVKSVSSSYLKISWSEVDDAEEYKVYRSSSSDGKYKLCGTTENTYYKDKSIKTGTKYYYKVRAVSDGEYDDSALSKWKSGKVSKSNSNSAKSSAGKVVYITKTGEKYHVYGCRYLKKSCIEISLSSAKNQGYTACSVCY